MRMNFDTGHSEAELPFRVLVVGDFASGETDEDPRAAPRIHRVDGSSFAALMKELVGPVKLDITGLAALVEVPVDGLKSFRPESILPRIPGGRSLLAARQALTELAGRKIGLPAARAKLSESALDAGRLEAIQAILLGDAVPPGAETPGSGGVKPATAGRADAGVASRDRGERDPHGAGDQVEELLSMFEMPEEQPRRESEDPVQARAKEALSGLFGSPKKDAGASADDARRAGAALARLDEFIAGDVEAVLHHPDFRRLESAWRGLRFLLSRADLRSGIAVDVLPAPPAKAVDRLRRAAVKNDAETGPPISLIIAAYEYPAAEDLAETLAELARAATMAGAPLVTGVGAAAVDHLVADAEWEAFRAQESAEYLGVAANAILLRPFYGPDTDPVDGFAFAESAGGALWGSPAWAIGVAACRSFAKHGWPTHFEGQVIEDLPLKPGDRGQLPAVRSLTPEEGRRLVDHGIIPLAAAMNRDEVRLWGVPSAHKDYGLSYRLATTRLVAVLREPLRHTGGMMERAAFEAAVRRTLSRLLPQVKDFDVQLGPEEKWFEGVYQLTLRLKPGPPVLPSPRGMSLTFLFGC